MKGVVTLTVWPWSLNMDKRTSRYASATSYSCRTSIHGTSPKPAPAEAGTYGYGSRWIKNITLQKRLGLRLTFLNMKKIEKTYSFFFNPDWHPVSDTIIKRLKYVSVVSCGVHSSSFHQVSPLTIFWWRLQPLCSCGRHTSRASLSPRLLKGRAQSIKNIPANTIYHQWFL